jgi:hypothetical protein
MVEGHYNGATSPLTGFSSWAASLHLVLFYAQSMVDSGHKGIHVAVMDIKQLDELVLVWHVPQLLGYGAHEYLAYGPIRGKGYTAVPFDRMPEIFDVLPEIRTNDGNSFGDLVRERMFSDASKRLDVRNLPPIRTIASLFGHLFFPMAMALISLRPRPWMRRSRDGREPTDQDLLLILQGLGYPPLPEGLVEETWLQYRMVNTTEGDFPDVQQWIDFTRAMAKYGSKPRVALQKTHGTLRDPHAAKIEQSSLHQPAAVQKLVKSKSSRKRKLTKELLVDGKPLPEAAPRDRTKRKAALEAKRKLQSLYKQRRV